jgi:nucleoside-diphosphate-sugar epimerase
MKVLITGGTGFIGSHVATTLVAWGHVPVIFDRTKRPAFTEKFPAYHFTGDVRDRGAVYEAVYHSDAVIHLAAQLGTQETIATARLVAENNILGSLNVFDACHDHDKRAVYIGVGNHWMNNPYSITKTRSAAPRLPWCVDSTPMGLVRSPSLCARSCPTSFCQRSTTSLLLSMAMARR